MPHKTYEKEDILIHWESELCIHSGNCVNNLGSVFKPRESPWIQTEHADKESIIEAVERCPSGALRWSNKEE
jgi:uncharacterized Fe-S cluster protein YjdI